MSLATSTPSFSEFDPTIISSQLAVLKDLASFDYTQGTREILLSGSVGSSKTMLMAHIAVYSSIKHAGNIGLIGRRSIGDLRDTLWQKILDHLADDFIEDEDYWVHRSTLQITFRNRSKIFAKSWADKRYTKVRSLDLGFALIEELTENSSEEFRSFYKEIYGRVGRLGHVKDKFIICATNPDSPSHSAHEYFIESDNPCRKVFYSLTKDNPFLPPEYIEGLRNTLTTQEAKRMLEGEWVEIRREFVYYAFSDEKNVIDDYIVNTKYPIQISFDFNISAKKPMSVCLSQYVNGKFYFFEEVVIYSSNTRDVCDELISRGIIDIRTTFVIRGDASGRAQSSKFNQSDYDIINDVLSNYMPSHGARPNVIIDVPLSNPPVRKRHVIVNGQLLNSNDQVSVYITRKCPTLIKGLRLTKMKEGSGYIEDDNDPWQHVTTALGYNILRELDNNESLDNFNQGTIHGDTIAKRNRYFGR